MNEAEAGQITAYALGELLEEEEASLRLDEASLAEASEIKAFAAQLSDALADEPIPEDRRSGGLQALRARPQAGPETHEAFRDPRHPTPWLIALAAGLILGVALGRFWPRPVVRPEPASLPTVDVLPVPAPVPPIAFRFDFREPAARPLSLASDFEPPRTNVPASMLRRAAPNDAKAYNLLLVHQPGERLLTPANLYLLSTDPKPINTLVEKNAPQVRSRNQPLEPELTLPPAPEIAPAW